MDGRLTDAGEGAVTVYEHDQAPGKDVRMARSDLGRKSADILLSLPVELKERMVNTITWTQPYTGIGHQQKFIRKAITDLCDRLEEQFNAGEAFEPGVVLPDE